MSSHIVKLHLKEYRDSKVVRKARDLAVKYRGVSDRFFARNQWQAWLAVEPAFKEDYEGLLKMLADNGIEATLEDPVRLVFSTDETDEKKIRGALKAKHIRRIRMKKNKVELYLSRDKLDRAELARIREKVGGELTSHVWIDRGVEGIDCADCVADLTWMAARVRGVIRVELDLKGRLRVLIRKEEKDRAERAIVEQVKSYGFRLVK